jgi:hypothetical protein
MYIPLIMQAFSKVTGQERPTTFFNFAPKANREALRCILGGKTVYLSKDLKWLGLNTYFDENSNDQITISHPYRP